MATSESWAQDVILCDLCDKPTKQFCNSCQVSLCDDCVGKHRDEFQSLSHEIVHFLNRKIQLAFPECPEHSGQRCEAYCIICNRPACIKCILSGPHKGHDAEELAEIHKRRILAIKQETQEIKDKIILNYQKEATDLVTILSEATAKFDDLEKQNKKHRQLWHKEVDNIFDKIDLLSQSLKEKNLKSLELYQNKIRSLLSEMTKTIKHNEKILKSSKLLEVTTYQSRLKEFRKVPEKVNVKTPYFATNIVQGEELSIEIGDFKAMLKQISNPNMVSDVPLSYLATGAPQLLNDAKVVTTIPIPTNVARLRSLACVGEAEVWILGDVGNISRVDIDGNILNAVATMRLYSPQDISVTKDGELIYSVYGDKRGIRSGTLNIFRNGKTDNLITTPVNYKPDGLCCTRSGDILLYLSRVVFGVDLSTYQKIVRYQQHVKTKEIAVSFINGSGSLFMAENNNGDICISDTDDEVVVVLDNTGEVRFRYDGTHARKKERFSPGAIVTDSLSQIIVTDENNDCLHIFDENGQFLRCMDECGLEKPCGLSVDSKGRLWVGLRDSGKIKVLEYL